VLHCLLEELLGTSVAWKSLGLFLFLLKNTTLLGRALWWESQKEDDRIIPSCNFSGSFKGEEMPSQQSKDKFVKSLYFWDKGNFHCCFLDFFRFC